MNLIKYAYLPGLILLSAVGPREEKELKSPISCILLPDEPTETQKRIIIASMNVMFTNSNIWRK